ncbi:MAG: hypothetical protein M5R36_19620 [Deltaproteobacteria bacterium]|nr:hypothetical protein [Deltaproteobacteria bacterium]
MSKGVVCMAAYRPHENMEREFLQVLGRHVPVLREEGYVTLRPPLFLKSAEDGAVIEIFEWATESASSEAHGNPKVKELWDEMKAKADFVTLADLKLSAEMFPHLEPLHGVVCR